MECSHWTQAASKELLTNCLLISSVHCHAWMRSVSSWTSQNVIKDRYCAVQHHSCLSCFPIPCLQQCDQFFLGHVSSLPIFNVTSPQCAAARVKFRVWIYTQHLAGSPFWKQLVCLAWVSESAQTYYNDLIRNPTHKVLYSQIKNKKQKKKTPTLDHFGFQKALARDIKAARKNTLPLPQSKNRQVLYLYNSICHLIMKYHFDKECIALEHGIAPW